MSHYRMETQATAEIGRASADVIRSSCCRFWRHYSGGARHGIRSRSPPDRRLRIMRKLISSGSPYEPKVGISRAVRVGSIIAVSGTAPLGPDGHTIGKGDPAAQARRCLEIIREALGRAGASLDEVIRTRTLLTRIEDWEAVASVHGEF